MLAVSATGGDAEIGSFCYEQSAANHRHELEAPEAEAETPRTEAAKGGGDVCVRERAGDYAEEAEGGEETLGGAFHPLIDACLEWDTRPRMPADAALESLPNETSRRYDAHDEGALTVAAWAR